MIERDEAVQFQISDEFRRLSPNGDAVFFDIETTGLSPKSAHLYLIGVLYVKEGAFRLHQWFLESLLDEISALRAFDAFVSPYEKLISYNGDRFDLNFLSETAKEYGIKPTFTEKQSIDLLRYVRKLKNILNLERCSQKDVEAFLGISREDLFTGGELITVYEAYLESRDERLLKTLLLHNADDVRGMPALLPILNYYDALYVPDSGKLTVNIEDSVSEITVTKTCAFSFPIPLRATLKNGTELFLSGSDAIYRIPFSTETMKSFLPHPEDYWYLPEEETVIHKKFAESVDKNHRCKATREQCCISLKGEFVPALKALPYPVFKRAYDCPEQFFAVKTVVWEDYVSAVL